MRNYLWDSYRAAIIPDLFHSGDHDVRHTRRVLYLAGCIAEAYELSSSDLFVLGMSCVFHDIGREDDKTDTEHGEKSVQMIKEQKLFSDYHMSEQERDCIYRLIIFHCRNDEEFIPKNKKEWLLYCILKDADALDRVRFLGLKPRYLRLPESKKKILLAFMLLFLSYIFLK